MWSPMQKVESILLTKCNVKLNGVYDQSIYHLSRL